MPVDPSLSDAPSQLHGSDKLPYPCHAWTKPQGAEWAIQYGFCRHSLDVLSGVNDPRCPADCKHKAPISIAVQFDKLFKWRGAEAAAEWARAQRNEGRP